MNNIWKYLNPTCIKNWVAYKQYQLHKLNHGRDISALGKQEIDYSLIYADVHRKYAPLLSLIKYELNNKIKPTRIIWWCWLQGEDSAPSICKACLQSLRQHLPNYEIKVVTEQNMFEYIHPPKHIVEKYNKGIISRTHFSDILRTLLLIEHGGVWIDSTVFCTGYNIPIFDNPLFVYQNWKFNIQQTIVASSWMISATKQHPILCATRDLLYAYWEDNDKLVNYYLFHFFFQMAAEHYPSLWDSVPRFSNIPPHVLQFEMFEPFNQERFDQIKHMSDFHKLTWKHNVDNMDISGTYFQHIEQSCK